MNSRRLIELALGPRKAIYHIIDRGGLCVTEKELQHFCNGSKADIPSP
jgi:hypothetical protein